MDNELKISGKELQNIRKKVGISQKELAEILDVHYRTVQNWEKSGDISLQHYTKLCALTPSNDSKLKENKYYGGDQKNVNGDNIHGNKVTASSPELEKMLEILATSEQSLAKAQEHITSLLAIIQDLTSKV